MGNYNVPVLDGYHFIFFKTHWEIVGPSIYQLLLTIRENSYIVALVNQLALTLILKCLNSSIVSQFRPIALCNVVSKILTEVLANRIKSIMTYTVGPMQTSFVQGSNSLDDYIILQNLIHTFDNLKGEKLFHAS